MRTKFGTGVRFTNNDPHMVACVGKEPNTENVRIVDPTHGVVQSPPDFRYKGGPINGAFDSKVIEVQGLLG